MAPLPYSLIPRAYALQSKRDIAYMTIEMEIIYIIQVGSVLKKWKETSLDDTGGANMIDRANSYKQQERGPELARQLSCISYGPPSIQRNKP